MPLVSVNAASDDEAPKCIHEVPSFDQGMAESGDVPDGKYKSGPVFDSSDIETIPLREAHYEAEFECFIGDCWLVVDSSKADHLPDEVRGDRVVSAVSQGDLVRLLDRKSVMDHPGPHEAGPFMRALDASMLIERTGRSWQGWTIEWGGRDRFVLAGAPVLDGTELSGVERMGDMPSWSGFRLRGDSLAPAVAPRGVTAEQWTALCELANQSCGLVLVAAPAFDRNRVVRVLDWVSRQSPWQSRWVEWNDASETAAIMNEARRRVVFAIVEAFHPDIWLTMPGAYDMPWLSAIRELTLAKIAVSSRGRVCPHCGNIETVAGFVEAKRGEGCPECLGTGFSGAVTLLDIELTQDDRALLRKSQAEQDARRAGWITADY